MSGTPCARPARAALAWALGLGLTLTEGTSTLHAQDAPPHAPPHAQDASQDAASASQGPAASQPAAPDPRRLQRLELEQRLGDNARRLDRAHTPWPYVLMGAGAGIGLGSGVAGMAIAGGCEANDCSLTAAVGLLVVAGAAVLTAGVIWWRLQLERVQRLESERYRLRRDLEYLQLGRASLGPRATTLARLRLRF